MDPSERITKTFGSDSSLNSLEDISQEGASTSQPSSEAETLDRFNFNNRPDINYRISRPEGLFQQQYGDEMTEQEGQGERSAFSDWKKAYTENMKPKALPYTTPYQVQRKGKISSFGRYQKKCQCHYCETQKEALSGKTEGQDPPSWKTLVEGFTNLNFKTDTNQACAPSNEQPQDLEKEKSHQEGEKKNKRIPPRNRK
ncbi:protein FAM156A/FAM156B-like [Myotis daubentonii]|uniref:protein FAM156A/FAM156B-like n=1 Tax=Myotis daubentonii TaxID=98922 RepID=UPI002873A2D3|nr:protein FAM156A/FAM156B-like [Myotis daubentonii]